MSRIVSGRYTRLRAVVHRSSTALWSVALALSIIFVVSPVRAQTYTVLHSFGNGTDGAYPLSGVSAGTLRGLLATLWGSTQQGGTAGDGTLFRLTTNTKTWAYAVAHDFGGVDGMNPTSPPVGSSVLAHGVTEFGGNITGDTSYGTLYEIDFKNSQYVFTSLYRFCSSFPSCSDGANPFGVWPGGAAQGPYGTTLEGGAHGLGTIFQLNGSETVLHSFAGGAEGALPYAGLTELPSGLYYGTTYEGGSADQGTVFSFNPSTGAVITLHSFTGTPDGSFPITGLLTIPGQSNLYGVTTDGGAHGHGTVYSINASGTLSILYSFTGGADGGAPEGALTYDSNLNLYGTTTSGGVGDGTIFELEPSGKLVVLHTFCVVSGCPDGAVPTGVLSGGSGGLYGTTVNGGTYGKGVVFELVP